MSVYQENKIFINKFIKVIESDRGYKTGKQNSIIVYFKNPSGVNAFISYKADYKIDILDTPKKLYIGYRIKEVKRLLSYDYSDKSIPEMALKIYCSNLNAHRTSSEIKGDIRDYLISKNVTQFSDGTRLNGLSDDQVILNVKSNQDLLKGFGPVRMLEQGLEDVLTAPAEITLHPEVLKSIKDREFFPAAYVTEDGRLYYPCRHITSRKGSPFESISLTGNDLISSNSIRNIVRSCVSFFPFATWVVFDIKSDYIDRRATMSYNYDL